MADLQWESPYVGDPRIVAGGVVAVIGLALIALFAASIAAVLVLLGGWFLGLTVGLHTQAIREAAARREPSTNPADVADPSHKKRRNGMRNPSDSRPEHAHSTSPPSAAKGA